MWPCSSCTLVRTVNVHLHNQVPILVLDVLEGHISQNTSIVDEDVYPAKVLDRSLDDLVSELNRVVVSSSLATSSLDLVNDNISSL